MCEVEISGNNQGVRQRLPFRILHVTREWSNDGRHLCVRSAELVYVPERGEFTQVISDFHIFAERGRQPGAGMCNQRDNTGF